jgi:TDG/mug DNA glycosylase family protein
MNQKLLDKSGALPEAHCVPDMLAPGLCVVFCGTALGRISAQRRAYYANPGNFFWRTLYRVGLTPHQFAPEEYASLLPLGIGLTDLCKTAYGNDAELPEDAFDVAGLRAKILRYQPRLLAFTSKTGAAAVLECATGALAYGVQSERIGDTQLFVLPSPSGHARRYWREDVWQDLATLSS